MTLKIEKSYLFEMIENKSVECDTDERNWFITHEVTKL